jgi:uncharacterized glyoxalase superfamily protein PhnB
MTVAKQTIYTTLRYRDAASVIDFLERAFGFERGDVSQGEDGVVHHAELRYAGEWIMLGQTSDGSDGRLDLPAGPAWVYVVVDDPDAHCERARAAGAEIVRELTDQDYGSREYTARDPEGNVWSFGTYRPEAA